MKKAALFIKHRAKPGCREDVRRVWEKFVKPRVEENPALEAYFFCSDDTDPDGVCVFQLYRDHESMEAFMDGEWYPAYLEEISRFVAAAPEITRASLDWAKDRGG